MKSTTPASYKQLALATASVSLFLISIDAPIKAATLQFQSSHYVSNFQPSDRVSISDDELFSQTTFLSETFLLASALESAEGRRSVISVSELTSNLQKAPEIFTSIIDSLKQVQLNREIGEIKIYTLPQSNFANVYEDVYEFTPDRPKPLEQLVGNYLSYDTKAASLTSMPRNYLYNNTPTGIGITGIREFGLPANASLESYANAASGNTSVEKQIGIALNRVSVEEAAEYDSALQLWPRTPFRPEPTAYGENLADPSSQTNEFGQLSFNVNYNLIPRDILLTPLDLQVDWVNRGEYSNNLRESIQKTTEYHQQRQTEYQARVEANRQVRLQRQKEYQSQIQQGTSQQFQSYERQRQPSKTRARSYSQPSRY